MTGAPESAGERVVAGAAGSAEWKAGAAGGGGSGGGAAAAEEQEGIRATAAAAGGFEAVAGKDEQFGVLVASSGCDG